MKIDDSFEAGLDPAWQITETGAGRVVVRDGTLHLTRPAIDDRTYHNAQISDYGADYRFTLRPPLRLTVTGRASHGGDQLRGTAGFGFWNHAFAPDSARLALPQALWFFFASPPSDMALAHGQVGHGWKAATFNAQRWPFLALLPTAPIAMPLMHVPVLYDALWPLGQAALGVHEAPLDLASLAETHTYTLTWLPQRVTFERDGVHILTVTDGLPQGALGFVAWLDNQYAVVTPRGRFKFGLVAAAEEQRLLLDHVRIEPFEAV